MVVRMSALCCLAVAAWDVLLDFKRRKVITASKSIGGARNENCSRGAC